MLALQQIGERAVDGASTGVGEFDPNPSSIARVRRSTHEAPFL